MTQISNKVKFKAVIALLLIISTITMTVTTVYRGFKNGKKIEKDGVYVIGKITSVSKGSKGTTNFDFTYVYKGEAYETSLGSLASEHKLDEEMFLRVSSSDPSVSMFIDGYPQPCECYSFETAPEDGWKDIPVCREMMINKYSFLFPFYTGDKYSY
jgi:hypothetical protein